MKLTDREKIKISESERRSKNSKERAASEKPISQYKNETSNNARNDAAQKTGSFATAPSIPKRPFSTDGGSTLLPAYKNGGKVKKTGPALVHKGEVVITKKQAKKPTIVRAIKKAEKK
jgi:hypothetical protein